MLDQLNIQINSIKNEIAKKQVLEKKLKDLQNELYSAQEKLSDLEKELIKEKKDVDNLKKLSLTNIVSTVLGNKSEKIETEEQEYIMAKIKYDSCKSMVSSYKTNIIDIEGDLNKLSNYENQYSNLLKKKIELINIYGDESTKNRIFEIENKIDNYLKEISETIESISVGNKLLSEIYKAKKLLNSAKNWSTFDILGGGLLSSMAKHNKIDEAQSHFSTISYLTNSFNKELKDVNIMGVEFSATTKTFDIFFDNIFTDLSADKHINQSYDSLSKLEDTVENILENLKNSRDKLLAEVTLIRSEYDEFIQNI